MQDRSIFFGEPEWNEMVEYRYRDESRCRLVTFQSGCPLVFALESGGGFTGAKDRAALACRKFARTPMAAEWNAGGSR